MRYVERHIFLVLALFTTALSVLCYLAIERETPDATDGQYAASVQERVKTEITRSKADLLAVSSLLKPNQPLGFDQLMVPTAYPYYIFRHSLLSKDSNRAAVPQLIFWSDYHFVPDFQPMVGIKTSRLIEFEKGTYIVNRQQVVVNQDVFDVFSLINVLNRSKNNSRYVRAGYNSTLFTLDPRQLLTRQRVAAQPIYDNDSLFLFAITPPRTEAYQAHSTPLNTLILSTLAALFLGVYIRHKINWLHKRRRYEVSLVWLCAYLLLLRGLAFCFGVPFFFNETDVFNPKFYAASAWAPSLGDQLLNFIVISILFLYITANYFRSATYNYLSGRPAWYKVILSLSFVITSYCVFHLYFTLLSSIYEKSQFKLDLTLSLHFSMLRVACLLLFSCLSAVYFLKLHLLASLFIRFNVRIVQGLAWLLIGSLGAVSLFLMLNWPLSPILILNGLYLLVLYIGRLPRTLYNFRYAMSIYLFLGAFVCALVATYVVYQQATYKDLAQKREFGKQLAENDELGEFLLFKAQTSIAADRLVQRAFLKDTLLRNEYLQQWIRKRYLDAYFDKYDVEIDLFSADGHSFNDTQQVASYSMLVGKYAQKRLKTAYANLYLTAETGNQLSRDYISFIPIIPDGIQKASSPAGYVVLNLKPLTAKPYSIYPESEMNATAIPSTEAPNYSYALFNKEHRILYSAGTYNYERKFPFRFLNDSTLFTTGISLYGYKHLALQGKKEHLLVMSSPDYPVKNVFANFSFLYLILVLTIVTILAGYAAKYGASRFRLSYLTRIQILVNVAFFLPLLLVMAIILSIISSNYAINQESTYISDTRNIAANFFAYLETYLKGNSSKVLMEEELQKIARDAGTDVNLFDTTGRLCTSTHPVLYQNKHLSEYLNPDAYVHLLSDKENQFLLTESLDGQIYKTTYVAIKAYNGRLLGVVSVPFFYADAVLDKQIIEVISSALSIFTALFLLFLVLSYFALRILTGPLKVITQKIRRTNLDKLNEPLPWKSDDEIGLLVDEYNRMLVKLEESKQALSLSEKQSAWREMAKQVAHEIKNPLTPMKLMLQHLKRTVPGTDAPTSRMYQRTFDSLLDQIDNLSDIATSFSDFAKMPLPKNETFEVASVLNKAADLYADDVRILLYRQIQEGPVMVTGDRQLMGRILTNLIINGVQSVPPDRQPLIDLRLYTSDGHVNIEVHDNGNGIPETIRSKVFLPNFSTKQDGSGLGLAIAKRGIEHAGGSIWFETAENVGTSFFITLPLAEVTLVATLRNGIASAKQTGYL